MGIEYFYYQLKQAEEYLSKGQEEKARQLALLNLKQIPSEPTLCFRWAKVCEELGLARYALKFYRQALRASPKDDSILFNYALLLSDTGYYEDAIHYLKKAIKVNPENKDAKALLSRFLQEMGFYGQAELLQDIVPSKEPVRYFPPTISKEHLDRLFELFSGKEVGYAIQVLDSVTSEPSFKFINSAITLDTLKKHINGDLTVALYPIRSDNTAKYAAIRIRIKNRILKQNVKNTGYLTYLKEKIRNYTLSLVDVAYKVGIPVYVDHSGDFSYRSWFFFKDFVHFLKIRRFLKTFIQHLPPLETYMVLEFLIGTQPIGIGWIEHPVILPFGINLVTKKRFLFIDRDGNPYEDQLKFLKKIQQTPFKDSFYSLKIDLHKSDSTANKELSFLSSASIRKTVEDMIKSCSVLKAIVIKANSGHILRNEEKLVLFYTVGLLDPDGTSLHRILYPCPDYNYTKVERQRVRLKPNPISCIKIRELIPELTSSVLCNCVFDLRGGRYPSPVMHVNPALVSPKSEFDISEKLPIKDVVRKYISLKHQKTEVDFAINKTVKVLEKYYRSTGKDRISIDGLTVYRVETKKGIDWKIKR